MKKSIFILLFNLIFISAFSQNSNVNKANTMLDQGKLAEAKELIDLASEHEKTMDKGRTWFIRGNIYSAIASSDDPEVVGIDSDAIQKSMDSYKKVQELEAEGSNYHTLTDVQVNRLYTNVFNKGIASYQEDEFMTAYDHFKDLIIVNPKDTVGYMYAGFCAEAEDEYDLALDLYYDAMKLDDCPSSVYSQTLIILERQKEDLDKALEVCSEAIERYPEDDTFQKTRIAFYIKMEKTEEAQSALIAALESEPENANLWYNLGYLYGETDNYEESVNAYEKSIEADPQYLDSYINLAYTYTEKGKEVRQEAMDMDYQTYQKKGAAIEDKANEYYKKAIPVLEKADELSPNDQAILESLNGLYIHLKMKEQADAMYKKLIELGYIEEEGN